MTDLQEFNSSANLTVTKSSSLAVTYTVILVASPIKAVWSIIATLLCLVVLTSLSSSHIWAGFLSAQPDSGKSFKLRKYCSLRVVEQGQFKGSETAWLPAGVQ